MVPVLALCLALGALLLPSCAGPLSTSPGTRAGESRLRVLIFGDSYTEGAGAEPVTKGYAHLIGDKLGWDVTVDGIGGTGYLAAGPRNQGNYLRRLRSAAPGPYDLVLLQGSSNDERQPLAKLAPAVDATVTAVRARYPEARILMMGPIPLYGSVPATKAAVNEVLIQYATSHGIGYVDPVGERWFDRDESDTMANPDNGHPSNAGHVRIRDRLGLDLIRLVGSSAT